MFYFFLVVAFIAYMIFGSLLFAFVDGMIFGDCSGSKFSFCFKGNDLWFFLLIVSAWPIEMLVVGCYMFYIILEKTLEVFSSFLCFLTNKCISFVSKNKWTNILGLYKLCYEMGDKFAEKFFR